MSELPKGWEQLELADCVEILDSKRKPVNNRERQSRVEGKLESELYPYYGATGQVGYIDDYLFDEELVALGEDGVPFFDPLKHKAYMISGKTWVNNHAHVLKGVKVNNKYLCYYLNQADYHGYVNGATRLKLTQANMRKMPIKVAPLEEQKRIADKLDSVLAKVEAAQARLDKIPTILKRFRQSVLAAATSGELTKDWREENDRSIDEWQSFDIGSIAEVKTGTTPLKSKSEYYESGNIPWLTSTVTGKDIVNSANIFVTKLAVQECRLKIFKPETLLVAMYGEGKTRGQVTELGIEATINQACAAVIVDKSIASVRYVKLAIEKNYELTRLMAEGGSQPNLNLSKVKSIPISIPTLDEQEEVVRKTNDLFEFASTVERQYKSAQTSVDKLTQSILAKAFRGELISSSVDSNIEAIENSIEAINA